MIQLGIVTYNIAKDWDLPTILKRLDALKYEGVELRTSHAHKVEVDLSPARRREIKKLFDDSPVELAGLGSAFEYQSPDPAEVKKNVEGTKEYVRLAHDLGAPGVKVRPNGVPKGRERRCHPPPDRPRPCTRSAEDADGFGIEDPRRGARRRDATPAEPRQDHDVCRSLQRLRLLELEPDRRRRRLDRRELRARGRQGSARSTSAT